MRCTPYACGSRGSRRFLTVGMLEASVGAKIAIVRNDRWIAVAVMGDTAYHAVANHEDAVSV